MTVKEGRATFSIERKEAATILGVSLRTIDRYIRSGKLTSQKAGYHVYLSSEEVTAMKNDKKESDNTVSATVVDHSKEDANEVAPYFVQEDNTHSNTEALMYKGLYEHSKKTIESQQSQLQAMHYKLGKLEVQLASAVPLLTFESEKQKTEELLASLDKETQQVREKIKESEGTIAQLQRQKMNYMVISIVLISLFVVLSLFVIPLLT